MERNEVERLYDEHAESIYRFLLSLARHPEDARDLLQDVFVRIARNDGALDGVADEKAFLFRIARNAAIDRARRIAVRRRLAEHVEQELFAPASDADADAAAFRQSVATALTELPEDQRTVVYLKLWEGLTFERLAEVCAISPNTAASRFRYGIDKLRALLAPIYKEIQP